VGRLLWFPTDWGIGRAGAVCSTKKLEFENMEYIENVLAYEDYCRLRESVGWTNFPNAEKSLKNSLYTIAAMQDNQIVGI